MKSDIQRFFRKSLLEISPYKSAREEYIDEGRDMILLDANESPFSSTTNRYPDPMQSVVEVREAVCRWLDVYY